MPIVFRIFVFFLFTAINYFLLRYIPSFLFNIYFLSVVSIYTLREKLFPMEKNTFS